MGGGVSTTTVIEALSLPPAWCMARRTVLRPDVLKLVTYSLDSPPSLRLAVQVMTSPTREYSIDSPGRASGEQMILSS